MTDNQLLRKQKMPIIDFMAIIFFAFYYIVPSFSGSIPILYATALGVLYFGYVFIKDRRVGISFISIFIAIMAVAIAYTLLTDTKSISASASNYEIKQFVSKFSQYLFMYIPALFLMRTLKTANRKQRLILCGVSGGLFAYVIFNTLKELAVNPGIVRQWEEFGDLAQEDVGNYYFVYAIPIIMVGLSLCMVRLDGIKKVISAGLIVILFYFLFQAQYTLAILIAAIGFVLQVFLSLKSILTKIVFLVAVMISALFVPNLLLYISNNVESVQMAIRFKEVYSFFSAGDTSGYNLNGRFNLYWMSILAFFDSPIVGNRSLSFDGHATCFTILSDTGIIGGIPFYYLLFSMNKRVKAVLGDASKMFLPVFFCLLCMGFSNPIHSSIPLAFTTWFFVPLLLSIVVEEEKASKELHSAY